MKNYFKNISKPFWVARIVVILFLIGAFGFQPYSYYLFLRYIMTGVSLYSAFYTIKENKYIWAGLFGLIAIIFNPVFIVHLPHKSMWITVDAVSLVIYLASLSITQKPKI